ncbi:hypothetical protein ABZ349_19110 [Streptomyces niveus]|uniref:hypothetical protein n=1 Tax=Streptomyces niveus TaxID=193462 RepID=UPI0033C6F7B6
MSRCATRFVLDSYAQHAVHHGWSRNRPTAVIRDGLHLAQGGRGQQLRRDAPRAVRGRQRDPNQPLAVGTYAGLPDKVKELMPSAEDLSRIADKVLHPEADTAARK